MPSVTSCTCTCISTYYNIHELYVTLGGSHSIFHYFSSDFPPHPGQPIESEELTVEASDYDWDDEEGMVSDLTLVGIVGIEDPVREEVGGP